MTFIDEFYDYVTDTLQGQFDPFNSLGLFDGPSINAVDTLNIPELGVPITNITAIPRTIITTGGDIANNLIDSSKDIINNGIDTVGDTVEGIGSSLTTPLVLMGGLFLLMQMNNKK